MDPKTSRRPTPTTSRDLAFDLTKNRLDTIAGSSSEGQRRPTLQPVRGAAYEPHPCGESRCREANRRATPADARPQVREHKQPRKATITE